MARRSGASSSPSISALRRLTEETIGELREVFASLRTPPPIYKASRCRACSLLELCRPKTVARPARKWRDRMLETLLAQGSGREEASQHALRHDGRSGAEEGRGEPGCRDRRRRNAPACRSTCWLGGRVRRDIPVAGVDRRPARPPALPSCCLIGSAVSRPASKGRSRATCFCAVHNTRPPKNRRRSFADLSSARYRTSARCSCGRLRDHGEDLQAGPEGESNGGD